MMPAGNVAAALDAWPLRIESVTPLAGGWNSATWLVVTAQERYVAKLVDHPDAPGLISGLRVADFLAARGLACFAVVTRAAGPQVARWFTEGYAARIPQIGPQLAHLDCLVKARWLANAIYFCSRIERGIQRGSGPAAANHHGLAAAYAGMTASA